MSDMFAKMETPSRRVTETPVLNVARLAHIKKES